MLRALARAVFSPFGAVNLIVMALLGVNLGLTYSSINNVQDNVQHVQHTYFVQEIVSNISENLFLAQHFASMAGLYPNVPAYATNLTIYKTGVDQSLETFVQSLLPSGRAHGTMDANMFNSSYQELAAMWNNNSSFQNQSQVLLAAVSELDYIKSYGTQLFQTRSDSTVSSLGLVSIVTGSLVATAVALLVVANLVTVVRLVKKNKDQDVMLRKAMHKQMMQQSVIQPDTVG